MADKNYNLIPPEGDKDVGPTVFKILDAIITDKENLGLTGPDGIWTRNHELVHGKHWRRRPSKKVPLITANLIKDHRTRTVNELTDNNPTFNALLVGQPSEEQKRGFSILPKIAENWWNETEQQDKLETSAINNEDYGITIEKMTFDDKAEDEAGEAKTVIVDPYCFGWWPLDLTDISELQTREAVLFYHLMPVREARRRYPDFADHINPDTDEYDDALGAERREINSKAGQSTGTGLRTRINSVVTKLMSKAGLATEPGEEQVLLVECWCKDYTLAKRSKKVKGDNGDEEEIQEDVPKYTGNIRYILTCNDGKVVLEDRNNPNIRQNLPEKLARRTYLYNRFPFYGANSVKNTSNAWGEADVQQLEQLNIELDKAISQFALDKDRAVRRKVINPKTSGVMNTEFTNINGIINPVNSQEAQAIRFMENPQQAVDFIAAIDLFKELFFRISGSFELDQAQTKGKDVIAYKAIAVLLERAATMKRGKIRSISRLIRERGRMFISMVQNFYTEERFVAFRDASGEDRVEKYTGQEMIIPAKLSVVTGSTMPVSEVQRREEAREMFKANAIDQEELLERMQWPNAKEIIDRRNKGLYGKLFDKLQAIGVPPALIQLFAQVAQADDKKFEKDVKSGAVPNFEQLMMNILQLMKGGTGQPEQDPEYMKAMAEVQKTQAETEKIKADAALSIEKIASERIEQQVKIAGVKYDEEELKIRRAELIATIQRELKGGGEDGKPKPKGSDETPAAKQRGGYREQGMKSNNKEATT